ICCRYFFFSSRRRHTRSDRDWSSDVCSSDLGGRTSRRTRGRMWHLLREFFGRFDHLLTPCMAVPPFPVDQNYPATVAGKKMETRSEERSVGKEYRYRRWP